MRIWIDVLTPKQLLFSEPIIKALGKKNKILCTSRSYGEVSKLAKIRRFKLISVGKHGGDKYTKLDASIYRMGRLLPIVQKFGPELTISFCSPEAARISYGLGIRHVAFCDSPHAESVMRLTLPLIQKLLIPWVIPKKEFSKYGIPEKNIMSYKAIDAAVTIKRKTLQKGLPFAKLGKKNIVIRVEEEQAAYTSKSSVIIPIIKKIIERFGDENVVILGRYDEQVKSLQRAVGDKASVLKMSFDGKILLENADVFVGSGGTMTAESALMGVPTISYNAVPNIVEKYLVKSNLVKRETNPHKIIKHFEKIFRSSKTDYKNRAKANLQTMEDPIQKLISMI